MRRIREENFFFFIHGLNLTPFPLCLRRIRRITRYLRAARAVQRGGRRLVTTPLPPDATVMLQSAGGTQVRHERRTTSRLPRTARQARVRRTPRAGEGVYAATLGDALGWDKERVEEALVRVARHEDGLVAVELALQSYCAEVAVIDAEL